MAGSVQESRTRQDMNQEKMKWKRGAVSTYFNDAQTVKVGNDGGGQAKMFRTNKIR